MQRPARRSERLYLFCNIGIFNKRGCVVGLVARINNQRPIAAPVFIFNKTINTVNIMRGIGPCERDPEKIVERARTKRAIIDNKDKRQTIERLRHKRLGKTGYILTPLICIFEIGTFNSYNTGQRNRGILKSIRQGQITRNFSPQIASLRTGCGDHNLGTLIKPRTRIIQRINRRTRLKVEIAPPIHPLENVDKISADIVGIQMGIIFPRANKKILCQRARAKTEQCIGQRENLLRLSLSVGHIAFRTNGNKQRMNTRRIHSINRLETGNLDGNHRTGNLVDKRTKCRIFLRGTPHNSKGINSISPVPNIFHLENGKLMRQTIIPQMIAKRTLGFGLAGMNHTSNNKISLSRNNTAIPARIAKPTPGQTPAKIISDNPSGKGITAENVCAGGPPIKILTRKGSPRLSAFAW